MLFYNRLVGDELDPSKLKLRTSLYEVKGVKGDIYTSELCESPDVERRAHVGQLVRYRGGDAQDFNASTKESPASTAAAAKQVFLEDGRRSAYGVCHQGRKPLKLKGGGGFEDR